MGRNVIQIQAPEDGCVYLYDVDTHDIRKLCDIYELNELPPTVIRILKAANLTVPFKNKEKEIR